MKAALKQRLVGLVLLVLLLTLLVPWVLQVPDKLQLRLDPEIPETPAVVWQSPVSPIAPATLQQAEQQLADAHTAQPVDIAVANRAAPLQAFALKLGEYDSEQVAEVERQRLNDAGYRAYVRAKDSRFLLLLGPDVLPEKLEETGKQLSVDKRFGFSGITLEMYVP